MSQENYFFMLLTISYLGWQNDLGPANPIRSGDKITRDQLTQSEPDLPLVVMGKTFTRIGRSQVQPTRLV